MQLETIKQNTGQTWIKEQSRVLAPRPLKHHTYQAKVSNALGQAAGMNSFTAISQTQTAV